MRAKYFYNMHTFRGVVYAHYGRLKLNINKRYTRAPVASADVFFEQPKQNGK